MAEDCCSLQLISGDGVLNREGLENFSRTTNLSQRGVSYAVVAIMGPQSGGKSTLLNKLFHTDFRMMDAEDGRTQTTQGIWMAKAIGIDPFTVAIDVEGSDSRERGQGGATFEKQSALFALAIADIVIINMWCHDIGREHAASRPLLKTVFEAMTRSFRSSKTSLLFVLRDQTMTPLELLQRLLRQDIEKIWAAIAHADAHKRTPLDEFFNVEITALPSYELEEMKFTEQVARLRERFFLSTSPGGLAGDRKDGQPASGLPLRAQQIWETVKKNKDLDLPPPQVLVATFRCEQIAKEKLSRLKLDEDGATFEKQSALFASAIADIVLINMWCHDIGREHAANRPLLKAVFEAMLRLFRLRKTTLLFVLRDQTKTPFERLELSLSGDIEKIWTEIPKPYAYRGTPLGDFFKVEITALPSYEFEEDKFKVKVDRLRQRFFHSISPGGLAGDRRDAQPASGFALRAEQIWKTIKENKDLDLPAMEVMVATFRCDQIAKETLSRLSSDKTWLALRKDVQARKAPKFKKSIKSILEKTLSQYDTEAIHFKESIRDDKRKELETEALQVLYPAYAAMLRHLRSRALQFFKTRLIKKVKRATRVGFEASIESTVQHAMDKFEKESRDVSISKVWDASAAKENLFSEIETPKYKAKTKFYEVYNTMKAKAVRSLAQGIGGMTAAGVATATFIGDGDALAAKKAGCAASKQVKRIIKRHMLKLDSFNYNTITDSSASPDCENASDTADDSGDDLAEDTDDDGADDDVDSENDMTDDD